MQLEEILPAEAAREADVTTLAAETALLEGISQGVALSLAYCEGEESCEPAVSREELTQLLQTLDRRITALAVRYNQGSEPELEQVLLTYAEVRDAYNRYLDQLEEVTAAGEAPATVEDALSDDVPPAGASAEVPEAIQELFEDADEALTNESAP